MELYIFNVEYLFDIQGFFSQLRQRDPQYRKLVPKLPNEEDWVLAKEMYERLKPFFKITEFFSGTSYPTTKHTYTDPFYTDFKSVLFCFKLISDDV